MTMFVVGFICGGVVIGTLVAALFLSMGSSTDAEAQNYAYFEAYERAEIEDMPTSDDSAGEGGG